MCSAVNDNYVMNVIKSLNKYAKEGKKETCDNSDCPNK